MNYVVDPWSLFDFGRLVELFVEQFIPSCVGMYWNQSVENNEGVPDQLWGATFNAAFIATITRFNYRLFSPIATEPDVERLILIDPDMTESDLKEIFLSCVPSIYRGSKPFIVRFHGYSADSRELWEIDRVVFQCQMIVKLAGISVLYIFPDGLDRKISEQQNLLGGLGAFHIWAIATGMLNASNRGRLEVTEEIFEQFLAELMQSNAHIDTLARSEPDWPLPVSEEHK